MIISRINVISVVTYRNLLTTSHLIHCEMLLKMPLLSSADLELTETEIVHCFGVLALRAKCDYSRQQVHLLKCSVVYLGMASLCLNISLGSAVALLV